eukprot:CAMPEP_0198278508 /NCGR_PEP_ID=MMETSP1447-20131203/66417_1 /TAXON_ID=420782 /ORGANISM="Chaetoceros dichaeta, Strain CCMP1751" /LENGTH=470 /DNA_ID=CAMNT_0043973593 /DNA_START=44 /DNA_END=1458 /DNA_ORIENTATION=-
MISGIVNKSRFINKSGNNDLGSTKLDEEGSSNLFEDEDTDTKSVSVTSKIEESGYGDIETVIEEKTDELIISAVLTNQTDESRDRDIDIASIIESRTGEKDDGPGYTIWNAREGIEFSTIQGNPTTEEGVVVSMIPESKDNSVSNEDMFGENDAAKDSSIFDYAEDENENKDADEDEDEEEVLKADMAMNAREGIEFSTIQDNPTTEEGAVVSMTTVSKNKSVDIIEENLEELLFGDNDAAKDSSIFDYAEDEDEDEDEVEVLKADMEMSMQIPEDKEQNITMREEGAVVSMTTVSKNKSVDIIEENLEELLFGDNDAAKDSSIFDYAEDEDEDEDEVLKAAMEMSMQISEDKEQNITMSAKEDGASNVVKIEKVEDLFDGDKSLASNSTKDRAITVTLTEDIRTIAMSTGHYDEFVSELISLEAPAEYDDDTFSIVEGQPSIEEGVTVNCDMNVWEDDGTEDQMDPRKE